MENDDCGGVTAAFVVSLPKLGIAYASGVIPFSDGTIQGCYVTYRNDKEGHGRSRVVSDAEKCRRNEVALAWNQNGGGDGQGSFLVGGFLNFSIPSHSSSTPPSSTSTPVVVTTTVLVNGADTDLEVVVPNSALPVVTIDLVHEVTIHQGEIISIRATLSGGGLASHSVCTISGNLCASEDVCSMAAPRDGTLKNLVVNSLVRNGNSFHIPSLQYK